MRPQTGCHTTNTYHTQLPHSISAFLLFLDDICRLCGEVDWIFSLLAGLKKLLSSRGWWWRSMQVPCTGSNIIVGCVLKEKVQSKNSRTTWLPTTDFLTSVRGRQIRAANHIQSICWVSERRGLVAVGHTTHTGKKKSKKVREQF